MFLHSLRERTEYYSFLGKGRAEGGCDRYGIENGINSHSCQGGALVKHSIIPVILRQTLLHLRLAYQADRVGFQKSFLHEIAAEAT